MAAVARGMVAICALQPNNTEQAAELQRRLSTARCSRRKGGLEDQRQVDVKENILPTKPRPSAWREGDI